MTQPLNRRQFISTLAATIGAGVISTTLDPERLLWVPGAKTIFVPPPAQLTTIQFRSGPRYAVGDIISFGDGHNAPIRLYVVTDISTTDNDSFSFKPLTGPLVNQLPEQNFIHFPLPR